MRYETLAPILLMLIYYLIARLESVRACFREAAFTLYILTEMQINRGCWALQGEIEKKRRNAFMGNFIFSHFLFQTSEEL